jgi:hypothetical protein
LHEALVVMLSHSPAMPPHDPPCQVQLQPLQGTESENKSQERGLPVQVMPVGVQPHMAHVPMFEL